MPLVGRLHPLLIHFPIALVIAAVAAECAAAVTRDGRWRTVALGNVRFGAAFALLAAAAGWRLASAPNIEPSPLLEWHRWLGVMGAVVTFITALTTFGLEGQSRLRLWMYRMSLFGAGILMTVAGHFGGVLVWGADFLRP